MLPQEVAAQQPRGGPHKLFKNINITLCFRTHKIKTDDRFLAVVNLVRGNNSIDVMDANDILSDVEGYDREKEEDAMEFESDLDNSDSTSERSDYPCPFFHTNFINQEAVIEHM